MEILKKYPKSFQWLFLLIIFFGLCFAIDVPEGYKFIRSVAEHSKDPNLSSYNLFGIEVRYYGYDNLWRLPPYLGWLPIWVNDSCFFYWKIGCRLIFGTLILKRLQHAHWFCKLPE